MAITITSDTVGSTGRMTAEGFEFDRIFTLQGVTGEGKEKIYNAMVAVGISIGQPHDTIPSALLRTVDTVSNAGDVIQLRYTYSTVRRSGGDITNPDDNQTNIVIDSSLTQIETEKDNQGNRLALTYDYSTDDAATLASYSMSADTAGEVTVCEPVSIDVPVHNIEYVKKLYYSPGGYGEAYVGSVNAGAWKSFAARTLKCDKIRGVSNDDGYSWACTFGFQYNPDTWDFYLTFTLPTGKKPTAAQLTANPDAWAIKRIYREMNFGGLPL